MFLHFAKVCVISNICITNIEYVNIYMLLLDLMENVWHSESAQSSTDVTLDKLICILVYCIKE